MADATVVVHAMHGMGAAAAAGEAREALAGLGQEHLH
jgi:hypothetical protein